MQRPLTARVNARGFLTGQATINCCWEAQQCGLQVIGLTELLQRVFAVQRQDATHQQLACISAVEGELSVRTRCEIQAQLLNQIVLGAVPAGQESHCCEGRIGHVAVGG